MYPSRVTVEVLFQTSTMALATSAPIVYSCMFLLELFTYNLLCNL